jgi:hypothetical protein
MLAEFLKKVSSRLAASEPETSQRVRWSDVQRGKNSPCEQVLREPDFEPNGDLTTLPTRLRDVIREMFRKV